MWRVGMEERNVPAEENKAIFRRYIEEVGNRGNLRLADEIFGRYVSHQPERSAETSTTSSSWKTAGWE